MAALSACSPKTENSAAPANDVTAPDTANDAMANDTAAAWTGFEPGTYVVTDAKGAKVDFTINSRRHLLPASIAAGKTETGTFAMKGAKGCFTAEGRGRDVLHQFCARRRWQLGQYRRRWLEGDGGEEARLTLFDVRV